MDNRGTFDEVTFGDAKLQIASLGNDLIEQLKELSTSEEMIFFVAKHGLSVHRERISEGDKAEDLPVIWGKSQMKAVKGQIVDAVLELSGIAKLISDKESVELADLQAKEDLDNLTVIDGDNLPEGDVSLGDLQSDNAQEAN